MLFGRTQRTQTKKRLYLLLIGAVFVLSPIISLFQTTPSYAETNYNSLVPNDKYWFHEYASALGECFASAMATHKDPEKLTGNNLFNASPSEAQFHSYATFLAGDQPMESVSCHGMSNSSNEFSKAALKRFGINGVELLCAMGYTKEGGAICKSSPGKPFSQERISNREQKFYSALKKLTGYDHAAAEKDPAVQYAKWHSVVANGCVDGSPVSKSEFDKADGDSRISFDAVDGNKIVKKYYSRATVSKFNSNRSNGGKFVEYPYDQKLAKKSIRCFDAAAKVNQSAQGYLNVVQKKAAEKMCSERGFKNKELEACVQGVLKKDKNSCTGSGAEKSACQWGAENANNLSLDIGDEKLQSGTKDQNDEGPNDCAVTGVGWWVCPLSNSLASGMDWVYGQLARFLETRPLEVSSTTSGLYIAWNTMRGFANTAFIIGFLIIIYSQITSIGISNYGIKRLLPRLIVAAILVNLSFYICAILIDMSNIAGHVVQDIFVGMRETMTTQGGAAANDMNFGSVTAAILSNGAIAAGGIAAFIVKSGGIVKATVPLLFPLLIGMGLILMVVLIIMAARQAMIIILTIISPLAFVAYLLPGTETWFRKWRETMTTLLIFFPAFSAVFGGSQLAAAAIKQNASNIVMMILALAVQVAPLAIVPLLLKLSGGLLNRFAGIVNDKGKGLFDRSWNWAQGKKEDMINRSIARSDDQLRGKRHTFARLGKAYRQRVSGRKEEYEKNEKAAELEYLKSAQHAKIDRDRRFIDDAHRLAQSRLDTAWARELATSGTAAHRQAVQLQTSQNDASLQNQRFENQYKELETTKGTRQYQIGQNTRDERGRSESFERVASGQFAERVLKDQQLQDYIGGPENAYYGNAQGSQRVKAQAYQATKSAFEEAIKNATVYLRAENIQGEKLVNLAQGKDAGDIKATPDNITAAVRSMFEDRDAKSIMSFMNNIGDFKNLPAATRDALADALRMYGGAPFMGNSFIKDLQNNNVSGSGQEVLDKLMGKFVQDKVSSNSLNTNPEYLEQIVNYIQSNKFREQAKKNPDIVDRVKESIDTGLGEPMLAGSLSSEVIDLWKDMKESLKSIDKGTKENQESLRNIEQQDSPKNPKNGWDNKE